MCTRQKSALRRRSPEGILFVSSSSSSSALPPTFQRALARPCSHARASCRSGARHAKPPARNAASRARLLLSASSSYCPANAGGLGRAIVGTRCAARRLWREALLRASLRWCGIARRSCCHASASCPQQALLVLFVGRGVKFTARVARIIYRHGS